MMFKKFFELNMEMDEMIESKQNKIASRAFFIMNYLCIGIVVIKLWFLNASYINCLGEIVVWLVGSIYFTYYAIKENIPLFPKKSFKSLFIGDLIFSISFGIFIGIRNVFFLYRDNLIERSLMYKIQTAFLIAVTITLEILIICMISIFFISKFANWQNKKILEKIQRENDED